jgi:hypothetical protein
MKLSIECDELEIIKYNAVLKYESLIDGIKVPIIYKLRSREEVNFNQSIPPVYTEDYFTGLRLKLTLYYNDKRYKFKFLNCLLKVPKILTINITRGNKHPIVTFCDNIPKSRTISNRSFFHSW